MRPLQSFYTHIELFGFKKPHSRRVPKTNIKETNNMKLVCVGSARVFEYQHVGIGETKLLHWGVTLV